MATAIFIGWWSFLLAALLITVVDVYLLLRVVSLCRQIRTLSAATLPAAAGIAKNTQVGEVLGRTVELVLSLTKRSGEVQRLTGAIGKKLV